ncbi:helix-turn-helix domain-containing protein [Paenibacillus sp. FSL M7-0420]|uniref:helix-turn-helix domain-containing protein n=1 Tax=Paenibacillus sp. FSL M7-0420 TaxID=2921609 RepID=UPI0030F6DDCE
MDYALLGARLRQERQRLNMTQEKLAEMVDISHAYIGQIERAERSVTLDTLVRLANQLGVTIDDLLHESIEISDEFYANKINKLLNNRSSKEQKMALEMLELMFLHLDDISFGKTV